MNPESIPDAPEPLHVPEHLKQALAGMMFTPEMTAALSMARIMDPLLKEAGCSVPVVAGLLEQQARAVAEGDLDHVRRTLSAQITSLDQMFHHLFTLATVGSNTPEICERFMRLAMRAQAQSARTSHILARLSPRPAADQAAKQPASSPAPARAMSPAPHAPAKRSAIHSQHRTPGRPGRSLHGLSAPAGT